MPIELGTTANKVRETIARKMGDIVRGHTLAEETRVLRMLSGNISPEDIERHKEELIRDAALPVPPSLYAWGRYSNIANSVVEEIKRQKDLTPEQLRDEVIRDARQKAKEWNLKLTA